MASLDKRDPQPNRGVLVALSRQSGLLLSSQSARSSLVKTTLPSSSAMSHFWQDHLATSSTTTPSIPSETRRGLDEVIEGHEGGHRPGLD